jgi:dipeptidyl aminopeptidase/acylaminoacyl peptidase
MRYGTWASPITADLVATGGVSLGQVEFVGESVFWIEGRSAEGGRCVIVGRGRDGRIAAVTPPAFNVRSRVHEYGGGAYIVSGETVFITDFPDQHIVRLDPGEEPRAITPETETPASLRYADGRLTPDGRWIICVREDHRGDGEAVNAIVAVPTDGSAEPHVVIAGRTFFSFPRIHPDGTQLAWTCWDHPSMPWDGAELWTATLTSEATVTDARHVAGGPEESVYQPEWSPDGRLHFVSDASGWWNLYVEQDGAAHPLAPMAAEFGVPQWGLGSATYAFLDDGRIACIVTQSGRDRLGLLTPGTGEPEWADLPYTAFRPTLRSNGRQLAFIAASPRDPAAVVVFDPASGSTEVVKRGLSVDVDPAFLPTPVPVEFPSAEGTSHALYFPPTNSDCEGPADEKPPLIVRSHGGPTGRDACEVDLLTAFWTSRGFAVVSVNYGGSTGYGRAYRNRLRGKWGIVDVEDCIAAARHLAERGDADPERLLIRGGSAGGYTTLCALAFHGVFAAGASYYGVADIEALARDTHKFESRYLDGLIGPYPEARALYRERSPLHAADGLSCPVIFFQGLDDRVVPPGQTEVMANALRDKGVPTACLMFEGEAHGFRKAETVRAALEAELSFYGRVLGIEVADEIEPVQIDNLD